MRYDKILLFAAILLIVAETKVFAYTDPGTGTLIWQVVMAAIFGAMFYLRRLIAWFRSTRSGVRPAAPGDLEARED
ncbi:MAG TPA: hypothetical protein VNH22_18825 [Blastocatellia bacterium]|jgi:hypothetical protein|nr:hypothetical protein [Blastocatellia bacterium]